MAAEGQTPPRAPRDYRPDLRPMLILVVLLIVVLGLWIAISPRILPSQDADAVAALAGDWTQTPGNAGSSTLAIGSSAYRLDGAVDFHGEGDAAFVDGHLTVRGDPACPSVTGRYAVALGDVDRYGLLPQFRAQSMTLRTVDDPCADGRRARAMTGETWVLRRSLRADVHGVCDPPNEEAAVTGHWPEPSGC